MGLKKAVMMHALAAFVIVLLSLPSFAAYTEKVHGAWQQHRSNFTVDNILFRVTATENPQRALISVGNDVFAVENNTCVDRLNMSVCLKNVDYPGEGLHSLFDPYDFRFYVEVYYYLAKILITRSIDPATFTVGETAEIEAVLFNNGSLPAEGVVFVDSFPPQFDIDLVYGCIQKGNNVTWEGRISPGYERRCTYWIKALNTTSFSSVAKASYLAGVGNRTSSAQSPAVTITVPIIELKINSTLDSASLWVDDNATMNITIENTHGSESLGSLFLSVEAPDSMGIMQRSPEFSVSGRTLNWNGALEPGQKISFYAVLRAEKSGNFSVRTAAQYRFGSLQRQVEKRNALSISIDRLALQEIVYNSTVRPGENATFIVNLVNPSSRYSFSDISANITTNLPVNISPVYYDEMLQKRFISLMDFSFTAPMWEDITTYTTTFDVSYRTKYGEKVNMREQKTFTVDPNRKAAPLAKAEKPASANAERLSEAIEKVGREKVIIIVVIAIALFLGSLVNFVRKVQKKVKEYG